MLLKSCMVANSPQLGVRGEAIHDASRDAVESRVAASTVAYNTCCQQIVDNVWIGLVNCRK